MYRGAIPGKRNRVVQNRIEKERGGRILERDSVSREEIIRRIESQLPDEMKKEKSDYVIFNDGEQALLPQITAFLAGLKIKKH